MDLVDSYLRTPTFITTEPVMNVGAASFTLRVAGDVYEIDFSAEIRRVVERTLGIVQPVHSGEGSGCAEDCL